MRAGKKSNDQEEKKESFWEGQARKKQTLEKRRDTGIGKIGSRKENVGT